MSQTTLTVLVVLRSPHRGLSRILVRCEGRQWTPVALRSTTEGARCVVCMRLRVPDEPGTARQVHSQLIKLVDVEHVVVDVVDGLPDEVAFAAVRHRAPFLKAAA